MWRPINASMPSTAKSWIAPTSGRGGEEWERVLRVNLTGTFRMCRAAWPHLIAAGGGAIINMSSFAAVAGMGEAMRELTQVSPPSASYSAAKAGIEGFTRYLAGLGARHHIRVNCVRPG